MMFKVIPDSVPSYMSSLIIPYAVCMNHGRGLSSASKVDFVVKRAKL